MKKEKAPIAGRKPAHEKKSSAGAEAWAEYKRKRNQEGFKYEPRSRS